MENVDHSLGLGPHLVGRQIAVRGRSLDIVEQLGEGGFSFVYLVRTRIGVNNINIGDVVVSESADNINASSSHFSESSRTSAESRRHNSPTTSRSLSGSSHMVLKITSISNTSQQHMAEKEASLLQMLSHPSIIQAYDACVANSMNGDIKSAQHLILMEYCEGGTAFDAIKRMRSSSPPHTNTSLTTAASDSRYISHHGFDLSSLVITFGQICNAVSYLHAQRPPIIHRDLKPVNFLIKAGAYKLCDFGSAVIGHTDLRTPENRRKAEEVVNKTTTRMFRAPEMVDLYMAKRLTESTDVWALGCCLFSLAFLCDCFEDSNLAILSRKYKIPDDNPYGEDLVDLIDRMLAVDYKERATMSEVIVCLSALYSNRPLPKRRRAEKKSEGGKGELKMGGGSYRTDGQGIRKSPQILKKIVEAKKLNPNSAAAKRKKANEVHKHNDHKPSSQTLLDSHPSSPDGSFQNFASFDEFESSFDHIHCGDIDSLLNYETIEATLETTNGSFSSAFGEKCQISVASSSGDVAGDSSAKSYDDGSKESC